MNINQTIHHPILITFILCYLFSVAYCGSCQRVLPTEQDQAKNKSQITTSRIINGSPSSYITSSYHAYIAELTKDGRVQRSCTGTRVSLNWIVTAAHCHFETKNWSAVLSDGRGYPIETIFRNPQFNSTINPYDIAAVQISGNPPAAKRYPLINNNTNAPLPFSFVRSTGYGWTENRKRSSKILREVDLPVNPAKYCRIRIDEKKQMCTGYPLGGCDFCSGDSGGPLIQFDNLQHPVIVAIASAGHGSCALARYPSICARVAHSVDWLRSVGVSFKTGNPVQYVWKNHPFK